MISYLWAGNGKMWSFYFLPFPSSHSHFHSHETSLAIPMGGDSHSHGNPTEPMGIPNIYSSLTPGRELIFFWGRVNSGGEQFVRLCFNCYVPYLRGWWVKFGHHNIRQQWSRREVTKVHTGDSFFKQFQSWLSTKILATPPMDKSDKNS